MSESGRSDDSFVIGVGPLSPLSSLEGKLTRNNQSMPPTPCIFETPSILLRHKKNAFRPNYFSIGPMHCDNKHLAASEKIKIMYLNGLLFRLSTRSNQKAKEIKRREILTELIDAVKRIEKQASACYAEHDFAAELGNVFVEVMVLDGCFIIELFRKYTREVTRETNDQIFSRSCMLEFLTHDLILLENQIPWFVLETLFEKTKHPSETNPLIKLTLDFFATTFSWNPPPINLNLFKGKEINHILDLLWYSLVLPSEIKDEKKVRWQPIRSITRLQEAGVKFRKVEPQSILDIKFENGTLKIPSLLIQETTETILRNLIAFEQCLPYCPPIFTCYAKLLDNLIDTPNDLEILCKNEIFDNWMSPEDATEYFNKLYNDTCVKEFYYSNLCGELNQHCKRWWPKWRAAYVHNYFTKPWAVAAQIYAVLMFVLALWQTCFKKG